MPIDGESIVQDISSRQQRARPAVVSSINDDPDRAQRAYELGQLTGAPAVSVFNNLDEFEQQRKADMASAIVANNPHLADFVQSNPMVPKIFNGQYGNLDAVSQKTGAMDWLWSTAKDSFWALTKPPKGFMEGFGEQPLGTMFIPDDKDWIEHPELSRAVGTALTIPELGLRTLSGLIHATATEIAGEEQGPKLAQVLMDPGLQATLIGVGPPGAIAAGALALYTKFAPAMPWLRNARTPPIGIVPEIDKTRVESNTRGVEQLGEAVDAAQEPKELNPELFKNLIDQHTQGSEISISGDAVARVYGENLPLPDDGLLGWVPNIGDQLKMAREVGTDVRVPVADWIAKVDPAVHKALADDILMHNDLMTVNEAKREAENVIPARINEPVPMARAAAGLEPMLSVGDRKLTLARMEAVKAKGFEDFHDFNMMDEKGNVVGGLNLSEQKGGKELYVEMIHGVNGLGPRDFGPALMFDLFKQVAMEFPEAKTLTGHRVSGMRDKFATWEKPSALVKIDLDRLRERPEAKLSAAEYEDYAQVLEGGKWETYDPKVRAYIKPYDERAYEDRRLIDTINEELARIIPNKINVQEADRIQMHNVVGQAPGPISNARGLYLAYTDAYPVLLYALEGPEPLGVARHEAIHHLRTYGFFDKAEWAVLEQAVKDQGWIERFDIDSRYPTAGRKLKLEEAIADAYKDWKYGRLEAAEGVNIVFKKLDDFFEAVKRHVAQLLGKEPTWEDIFKRVDTGEIGSREGGKALDRTLYDPKASVAEQIPTLPSRIFERAKALGITADEFNRYDKLIQKQYIGDAEKAERRAMEQRGREMSKQWKAERVEVRKDVAENIKQRPDVAADLFFGSGELYGKKVPLASVRLDEAVLTPEQKAMLPKNYYGAKGLNPDDVAPLFAYGSGDAMIQALGEYNVPKVLAKMSAKDYLARTVDIETDRQMQLKHGVLENNIMDAVQEQVAGDLALDIVHEETMRIGMQAGQVPLSREVIRNSLREEFGKFTLSAVNSDAYLKLAGRSGREVEKALQKGDFQEAFKHVQRREYAMVLANESMKLEKQQARFDRMVKPYGRRFDPTNKHAVDPEFSLFVRDILSKVERPYGMSVQGLADAISESAYPAGLSEFVQKTSKAFGLEGIELPVAEWLYQKGPIKNVKDLSVTEFRELNDSVTSLHTFGRNVKKWTDQGNAHELKELIGDLRTQVETKFPTVIDYGAEGKPGLAKRFVAAHTNLETMFGRFDDRDPNGLFTKTFSYPAARAGNDYNVLDREFSKKMKEIEPIEDPNKKMESPLIDPKTGKPVKDFTRGNLMSIVHNMGNDYNWRVFAKGWGMEPDVLWQKIMSITPPEFFERAQKVGDVFSEAFDRSRNVYANLYGIAPERIPVRPIEIKQADGTTKELPGWYHPLIRDELRSPLREDDPNHPAYSNFWPSTSNAYTKRRSGAVYAISLSQEMIPIKLNQVLHDIAYRQFVHETAKITRDKEFKQSIMDHYGPEYAEAIEQWLKKIAGNASYDSTSLAIAARWSNWLRQNVVASHIGFSPTTVMKHGPTALVFSAKEVGVKRFARAFAETTPAMFLDATLDLFGKSRDLSTSVIKFVEANSEEIQRRSQQFQETVPGVHSVQMGKNTFRQSFIEWGSKAVAFSDKLSAYPTWLAQYRQTLAETGDAAMARDLGDRAVRRAHGSTSVTNQPMIVNNRGVFAPWLSTVYGFWGTRMQRMIEIAHDVNDAYKLGKSGEIGAAAKAMPGIMGSTFVYVIWPMMVEEAVTSQFYEEKNKGGLLSHALAYSIGTIGQSMLGIRDIFYGIEHSREPSIGMATTLMYDPAQLLRDIKKDKPLAKDKAGRLVEDAITTLGDFTGIGSKHVGTAAHFGIDVLTGQSKPKTGGEIYRGIVSGSKDRKEIR